MKDYIKPEPMVFYMMVVSYAADYHDIFTDYMTTRALASNLGEYLKYRGCQKVYFNGTNFDNVARITYVPVHCNPLDIKDKIDELSQNMGAEIKLFSTMQEVRDYVEATRATA